MKPTGIEMRKRESMSIAFVPLIEYSGPAFQSRNSLTSP
jgi:hypothetical protein